MAADLQREHRLKPNDMSRILARQVTSSIASIGNDWERRKADLSIDLDQQVPRLTTDHLFAFLVF